MNRPMHDQPADTSDHRSTGIHWGGHLDTNIDDLVTLRVTSQNINGFASGQLQTELDLFHQHRNNLKASINMLQETNVNWRLHHVLDLATQTGRRAHKNITVTTSCSNLPVKGIWQPGGTLISSNGAVQNRLIESGSDPTSMGRWSWQTFRGQDNIKICFITAYRVCQQSITTAGEFTSFRQQWLDLRQRGHENPNPRQQFLRDLQVVILDFTLQGYDICLGTDANEELDDPKFHLQTFASACGLISIHESIFDDDYYGEHGLPNSRENRKLTIFYVLQDL